MRIGLIACALAALPLSVAAQTTGELWEITMQVPGMPAGMAMPAQRICQGDDPERAAAQDKSKRDCKVVDRKQSGTRTTVSIRCADGTTMTIDQQYNAARTEFKNTMTTKGGKSGDMTMTTTGRKVGTCDAVAERKKRDEKIDAMQKQAAAGQAQSAAIMKQQSDEQIKQCNAALAQMDFRGFGMHGQCYKKTDGQCAHYAEMHKSFPEATKACNANIVEYCKHFQTAEGFMKVRGREEMAKTCGVTVASIKATQCPRVAKNQSPLSFLGAYCPVEAKPIAMEHCTGRDYTSRSGGKYAAFCDNYLANKDFERPPGAPPARAASGAEPAASGAPEGDKTQAQKSADAVKEGVTQGVNKLKGLFGR